MDHSNPKTGAVRGRQAAEETRRIILDAAYSLFEEKGYDGTTMRELASRAGVALGTIFRHFQDKQSLLVAAFDDDLGAVIGDAFKSMPQSGIIDQLLHITRRIYEFYAASPPLSRNLLIGAYSLSGEASEKIQAQILEFGDKIIELISRAVDRGELPNSIDSKVAGIAYWAFYGIGRDMGLRTDHFDIDEQLAVVEQLLRQHFGMND